MTENIATYQTGNRFRQVVTDAVYTAMAGDEQSAHRVMAIVGPVMDDLVYDRDRIRLVRDRYRRERDDARREADADRARLLGIVAEWVHSASEFGGVDHGDLVDDLRAAGYTLPGDDAEENGR